MENFETTLKNILIEEKNRIHDSYPFSNVVEPVLLEIIRSLDYQTFMLNHDLNVEDKDVLLEKYRFGWSLAFRIFYSDLTLKDVVPTFTFPTEMREWVDSIIQHGGAINFCNQLLDYKKADLFDLVLKKKNHYFFHSLIDNIGFEYFEKMSLSYYHSIIEEILEKKSTFITENLPIIRRKLQDIVHVHNNDFIAYEASLEISNFYSDFGYLYLMTTQTIDYFDENDCFGEIPFKEYLDLVEYSIKMALLHRDCCMALAEKTNHQIYLRSTHDWYTHTEG